MNLNATFESVCKAGRSLAFVTEKTIHDVLLSVADAAEAKASYILAENKKDLELMDVADPKYDRLKLTTERIAGIAADIRSVASLPSPLGRVLMETTRPNGMSIKKSVLPSV